MVALPIQVLPGPPHGALFVGDMRAVVESWPARSIDLILADPPYSKAVHKAVRIGCTGFREPTRAGAIHSQTNRKKDLGFDHLTDDDRDAYAAEFGRLARRWVLVFSDQDGVGCPPCRDAPTGAGWVGSLLRAGLQYVRTMIWIKRRCPPQFQGDRPAMAYECIIVAHQTSTKKPGKPVMKRWNGRGKHGKYDYPEEQPAHEDPIVLNVKGRPPVRLHTTQKPLKLMEALVRDFSDEGELVVDPFAGSGTGLLAADRLGRRWCGIERKAETAETCVKRLREGGPC